MKYSKFKNNIIAIYFSTFIEEGVLVHYKERKRTVTLLTANGMITILKSKIYGILEIKNEDSCNNKLTAKEISPNEGHQAVVARNNPRKIDKLDGENIYGPNGEIVTPSSHGYGDVFGLSVKESDIDGFDDFSINFGGIGKIT